MSASPKVFVPIANGVEPMEAVIIIDVLRRCGADVTVASIENDLCVSANHDVKIVADCFMSECNNTILDVIILPGGIPIATELEDCGTIENMIKKHAINGRPYAAVCVLHGVVLKATCYLSFMEFMEQLTPICGTTVESRVDNNGVIVTCRRPGTAIVTSRGPGVTLAFVVVLVEQLYGKEKADEVAQSLELCFDKPKHEMITEYNEREWKFHDVPQILIPIASGSAAMETVMIIDILRRAKFSVVVASVEDKLDIMDSQNVKLVADMLLHEAAKLSFDLIILSGGLDGAQAFANSEKLVNLLKKQEEANRPYGATCASATLVLKPHGLLKGKRATTFPTISNKNSEESKVENEVVIDGNLITSQGLGTSMEFALAIVEKFFGSNKAMELKNIILSIRLMKATSSCH